MPDLQKATLQKLTGGADPQTDGDPIPVQFNPSTLHFTLASATDGSGTPAREAVQSLGSGNLTLTLELHFDSADEGTTEEPSNVRDKTAQVAQFMLPTHSITPSAMPGEIYYGYTWVPVDDESCWIYVYGWHPDRPI